MKKDGKLTSMEINKDRPTVSGRVVLRSESADLDMSKMIVLCFPNLDRVSTSWYSGFVPEGWVPWQGVRRDNVLDYLVMESDVVWVKAGDDGRMERLMGDY